MENRSVVTDSIGPLREALASRYEFQREIGQGAYATVYRALDLRHDRLVAIKVLNVDPGSDLAEVRFVREIKWLARLQHPNILPLHDSGHVGNLLYFITPYLSGESLRDMIKRERRLSVRDAARIAHEVADALQYAHGCGVVHRDIKPDNILLSGSHAIVADFGVARAIDTARAHQITRTGPGSPGTPAYMSPEQLVEGKNVDQRSDIYSLGCVLYEMLTGKAPFLGKEGFVRRFTEPPPSAREARQEVSPEMDAIIGKALAVEPLNRYSTAHDLAVALEVQTKADSVQAPIEPPAEVAPVPATSVVRSAPNASGEAPAVGPPPEPPRTRPFKMAAIASLAVIIVIGAFFFTRSRHSAALDENLLAVAPFSLFGVDTIWREGLPDVLVRNLDGAGTLRTVPSASSIAHWSGYSDRVSAENLGRAVQARLVVFGSVMRAGVDSVRVTANLMDVQEGRTFPALQWQDANTNIDRLTDSLTIGMLRQIGEQLGVRSLSHVSLASSTSLAALKEFLQGEQYFRRTAWDSAFSSYKRATELDSTFALALWRAGLVRGWQQSLTEADDYKRRADAHNHGLGPRDSLLIAADRLFADADSSNNDGQTWEIARRLETTLEEATRRYNSDAEVWYARGEALFHFPPRVGTVASPELLGMFERAISLDSTFAPPYLHAIELALQQNRDSLARRLSERYLELQPGDFSAMGVRLVREIIDNGPSSTAARRMIADGSRQALRLALDMVGQWPDSQEASIAVARQLLTLADVDGTEAARSNARFILARQLALRGHLRDSYKTLNSVDIDTQPRNHRFIGEMAFLGMFAPDSARAFVKRWSSADVLAARTLLPWLSRQRDSITIRDIAARAESTSRDTGRPDPVRHNDAIYTMTAAHAYLALSSGDSALATRLFDEIPAALCQYCYLDQWTRIRLLESAKRYRDAFAGATEIMPRYRGPVYVLFALEQARISKQLGDLATSRELYGRVVGLWRHPDRELEPYVRQAREALKR
jgi:TolB-like protein